MTAPSPPAREPFSATFKRNIAIALVAGAVVATTTGGIRRWPLTTLVMLWPTFGGHYVELLFLEWLRPRLPSARRIQVLARLATWFVAGIAIGLAMCATATALMAFPRERCPAWWLAGVAFVGLELFVHAMLQLRGRPNFHDARG